MKNFIIAVMCLFSFNVAFANSPASPAEKKVTEYYKWYVGCAEKPKANPCYFYKPSNSYVSTQLINKLKAKKFIDADYFLKAQDFDASSVKRTLKISTIKTTATSALIQVSFNIFDNSPQVLRVTTEKTGNDWKITKVTDNKNRE